MKSIHHLLSLLTLLVVTGACSLKYDAPLITEPTAEGWTPNVTIADLKARYSGSVTDSEPTVVEYDYILKARVVANDVSGNLYQEMYLQDETGGMKIGVLQNGLNTEFPVGQELYIRLHGMAMTSYGGMLQIGYKGTNKSYIPYEIFKAQVQKNRWPDADKAEPKVVRLSELKDELVGTLIEVRDVAWVEAGQPFATTNQTVNRNLRDGDGRTLIVRNSGYSNFAADKLPEGVGTVVGVLSKFRNDYQFFIRSREDVKDFHPGTPTPSNPTEPEKPGDNGNGGNGSDNGNGGNGGNNGNGGTTPAANLLFAGADFEDQATFMSSINTDFGLKFAEYVKGAGKGHESDGALHITGAAPNNGYIVTITKSNIPAGTKISKITMYIKGTIDSKSLSFNLHSDAKAYTPYNLGVVNSSDVTITKSTVMNNSTGLPQNDYAGSVNTGGKWVLVTIQVDQDAVNTTGEGSLLAIKIGKQSPADLYIDDIRFE